MKKQKKEAMRANENKEEPNVLNEETLKGKPPAEVLKEEKPAPEKAPDSWLAPRRVTPKPEVEKGKKERAPRKEKGAPGRRISQASIKIAGLLMQALASEWDAAALPENETMTIISLGKGGRTLKVAVTYTVEAKDDGQMKLL